MESFMVIKVKYGDTLRRFNASVVGEDLDLDMDGLRQKILSLFSFAPETDLGLTYIDEDGDIVTLVNDEDLHDAVKQGLNPLRITVKLNSDNHGKSFARSSRSSNPLRSPSVHVSSADLYSIIYEAKKYLEEMLSESSSDMAPKATTPGVCDLVDYFSKMGLSNLNQGSNLQAGTDPIKQNRTTEVSLSGTANNGTCSSKVDGSSEVIYCTRKEEPLLKNNEVRKKSKSDESNSKIDAVELASVIEGGEPSAAQTRESDKVDVSTTKTCDLDFRNDSPVGYGKSTDAMHEPSIAGFKPRKSEAAAAKEKIMELRNLFTLSGDDVKSQHRQKPVFIGSRGSSDFAKVTFDSHSNNSDYGACNMSLSGFGNSLGSYSPSHAPTYSNGLVEPPVTLPLPATSPFHPGVRCDGCGLHPITGPRFNSIIKEDYDLCSICFAEMGNDADYIRMDHPVIYVNALPSKGFSNPYSRVSPAVAQQASKGCNLKSRRTKLDSHFIRDVNVLDGTMMGPSTPFTKIWRMRNNGNAVWPCGTQLVWIGGDKLSDMPFVELKISPAGLPVDQELDVAVNLVAPVIPGGYVSYWRMVSPSGQKFGQRVWVMIQVIQADCLRKEQLRESLNGLNLNLPPLSNAVAGPEIINAGPGPLLEERNPEPNNSSKTFESVKPVVVDGSTEKEQETFFPINGLLIGDAASSTGPSAPPPRIYYPVIDMLEVAPSAPLNMDDLATEVKENSGVEATLLKALEQMGFKDVDLNKEILRTNGYDMVQSVDDLCNVSEWGLYP